MPNTKEGAVQIRAPIGIGELIDKITILEIKSERISDFAKLRNVATELKSLRELKSGAGLDTPEIEPYERELKSLNAALWDIEDALRELEVAQDFGPRFIEFARGVYKTNDRRAQVKHRINSAFGSEIVEEKSYKGT